jgi:hypothetical protein
MTITFTLTAETSGTTQSGNYSISGTTSGGALNGVFIASGITRAVLTTGYTATGISDSITGGTITSTGSESGGFCTEQIAWVTSEPVSDCECYTVYNEGGRDDGGITFTYYRCLDNVLSSLLVGPGSSRTVCVRNGTEIDSDSGLMTSVPCETPCTSNVDCSDCE